MNWLDIALAGILAVSAFRSFRRGFARQVIGLAAAALALIMGMWFYGLAGSYVAPYVASTGIANMLGFFLVAFGVVLCGALIGHIVQRFIKTVGLSFMDRLAGALFGLARGFLLAMTLLTAAVAFGPHTATGSAPSWVINSKIAPWILEASRYAVAIAPMDLKQSFSTQYTRIKSALEKPAHS